jgi:hypothetical protein
MTGFATADAPSLRGLVTEADLPAAEREWPGLQAFLFGLPKGQRPRTFLDLVWRFDSQRDPQRVP